MGEWTGGLHRIVTIPAIYERIQVVLGGPKARATIAQCLFADATQKNVLEIGCGPGGWAPYLSHSNSYFGVDWNRRHIETATRLHGSEHVRFICGDLTDRNVLDDDQRFDMIVGIGILHHLDDRFAQSVLRRSGELLTEEGMFVGLEPVIHTGQNPVARLLKFLDSGRNIRREAGYRDLMASAFGRVNTKVVTDFMRLPYSHCILRGWKDQIDLAHAG